MRAFLVALLLFTGWGWAQESSEKPSLAQLSREAKERRAKGGKPARLITNADLRAFQSAPVSMSKAGASSTSAETSEKPAAEGEAAAQPGAPPADADLAKQVEFWRGALTEARQNLKSAVDRGLVLQLRLNNLGNAMLREDDGTTQALIQAQLEETRLAIERNRQEIDDAKRGLDTLLAEAEKSGLDPGLIREIVGEVPELETITAPTTP